MGSFLSRLCLLTKKPDLFEHAGAALPCLLDLRLETRVLFLELGETCPRLRRRPRRRLEALHLGLGGQGALPEARELLNESPHHLLKLAEGCGVRTFWVGH